jgi:hypothetical protein
MTTRAVFNTLDLAKELETAGLPQKQAEAISGNLNKVLDDTLTPVINEMHEEKRDLTTLASEIKQGFAAMNINMANLETRLVKWMYGLVAGQILTVLSFILAVIHYTR